MFYRYLNKIFEECKIPLFVIYRQMPKFLLFFIDKISAHPSLFFFSILLVFPPAGFAKNKSLKVTIFCKAVICSNTTKNKKQNIFDFELYPVNDNYKDGFVAFAFKKKEFFVAGVPEFKKKG